MKAHNKDIVKEIIKSKTKFIALFVITMLGVSTFIGLNVLTGYMRNTINNLYQSYNVADIKIASNIGIDERALNLLKQNDNISQLETGFSKDIYLKGTHDVVTITSIPKNVSRIEIVQGSFSNKIDETILEYKHKNKYNIGEYIYLEDGSKLKITGFYENPQNRVTNSDTNAVSGYGFSSYVIYVPDEYFKDEKRYSFVNLKFKDLENVPTYEEGYKKSVIVHKNEIFDLLNKNRQVSLETFKEEKFKLLEDAKDSINKGLNELDINKKKLEDANKKIEDSNIEYEANKVKFESAPSTFKLANNKIVDGELNLIEGRQKLDVARSELLDNKDKVLKGLEKIEYGFSKIEESEQKILSGREEFNKNKSRVDALSPNIFLSESKIEGYRLELKNAETTLIEGENRIANEKANLISKKNELLDNLTKIEDGLKQISLKEKELEDKQKLLTTNKEKLSIEQANYYKDFNANANKLSEAKNSLEDARKTLEDNKLKFNSEREKALENIKDSNLKISNNEKELNSLKPLYILLTRFENVSYFSYLEGLDAISIISKFFPAVFLVIVLLVSTTIMTRMVDEQRGIIGTYKFLGYSNTSILKKYLIFGLIPSILGILIGSYIGLYTIPSIIYYAYKGKSTLLYDKLSIDPKYTYVYLSAIIYILSNILSVYLALKRELTTDVASLLKPKILTSGSSILLEKVPILWNRLSFFQKLTIRNLFRYKSRVLMNIAGILGSAALIFFAFAIKISVSTMPDFQFNKIYKFNALVTLKTHVDKTNIDDLIHKIQKDRQILKVESILATYNYDHGNQKNVNVYVVEDNKDLDTFVSFFDKNDKEYKIDDEGAYISRRALELIGKKIGDQITIQDYYGNDLTVKIAGTFRNHISNFIFLTKNYYEKIGHEYKVNSLFVKSSNDNYNDILDTNDVQFINLTAKEKGLIDATSESLDAIVLFISILSGLLAIVVTYSLLEMNVGERKRELATINVLGFYSKEVSLYIYKELLIMTIIGIILGYGGGKLLHYTILESMSKSQIVFVSKTGIKPYIFSSILTLIFSMISMLLIHKEIKNINMVECLKSE